MNRRLVALTAVLLAASLAGCSDDKEPAAQASAPPSQSPTVPPAKQSPPELDPSTRPSGLDILAAGVGPFAIGTPSAELKSDGLIDAVKDTGSGCSTATGNTVFSPPALTFAQGKLTQVRVTGGSGSEVGKSLAEVQAAYPGGTALTGTGGATGWAVASEANTVLFEIKADKVVALTTGTTATVTKVFTTGQGC